MFSIQSMDEGCDLRGVVFVQLREPVNMLWRAAGLGLGLEKMSILWQALGCTNVQA